MPESLLATKLFLPSPRSDAIYRDQLIVRLNAGLARKLTLVSAPAGFGKTTLLSTWLSGCDRPVAWLSLDEADSDLSRFLAYLVAALQTCAPQLGGEMPALLASQQPPPAETLLTNLLNAIAAIPHDLILVLDDYHTIAAAPVDQALTFLLDRLPPHLHLVIATREDPNIPLARYRARHELSELRAADLRFTPTEATEYLNRVMGLDLADDAIAVLDARTEGWITGLHLAALSLQGQPDSAEFIAAFTGSHQFVLDYLVEEVLQRQPEPMQHFLLRTAILDRMCGSLCDAVLDEPAGSGQTILEAIEHANLFIVPLDRERHWYRYHHLFRDLLRKRLGQRHPPEPVAEYQIRASRWFEEHGLPAEAFHYAAAADDVARAERLIEHKEMPLHVRGNVNAILDWLWALPTTVLDARPSLWVKSATLALVAGRTNGVAARLQAAEQALPPGEPDEPTRNLIGIIAAARATLAVTQYQAETTMEPPPLPPDVCPTCRGAGYMVADAPYGHPRFAKLIRCACTQTEQQQRRQGRLEQLSNLAEVRSLT
ncbi:AAA family ATPase, partial [Candidatus Chloroploca sp. Khr17]|uniref:AAA family ATPase n=1 Tax=Candidatus Chloroploca sp. Khr17 TaxID=2496869 RepID=UPI0035148104